MTSVARPTSVEDFAVVARQKISRCAYNFLFRGANKHEHFTLQDSINAFKRYRLRPRILQTTVIKDLSTTVLGQHIDMPIGVSPTAFHALFHREKEKGATRGAHNQGTVMILSSVATTHVNELHKEASRGLLWMQMYFFKTFELTQQVVRRAEKAGCQALVVTIDSSGLHLVHTNPESSFKSFKYLDDTQHRAVNLADNENIRNDPLSFDDRGVYEVNGSHATEDDIRWLRRFTKLPIIVKGVLSGATAKRAALLGVDGILVSAHGGRQLDGVPAPIDALAEVIEAVKDSGVEVYVDGGIRNGTDVLKALALGARAVFVGRPIVWGLAAAGHEGVEQVLQILKDELRLAMILAGCSDVRNVPRSTIVHESEYLACKL